MILILTNKAVFVTLSVVTIPHLAQGIFILMLNQADVIGDQSDPVTQNAWFLCTLCAAISGEISILIQTGAESWQGFLYQESAVGGVCDIGSKDVFVSRKYNIQLVLYSLTGIPMKVK